MANTNQIGLEKKDMTEIIKKLNNLLSSYHIFYINVRGYHWNVKGEHFFSLHEKFEELYTDLQLQIDEIAERILAIGGKPVATMKEYLELSSIQEAAYGENCRRDGRSNHERLRNDANRTEKRHGNRSRI